MTHPHPVPRVTLGRLAWRWFTGAHLDGRIRTDAGWLAPGSRALTVTGRAGRWAHRPRAHRAGVRLAVTLALAVALAGWRYVPTLTLAAGATLAAGGATWSTWRGYRWARSWQHGRRYVRPVAVALAGRLGYPASTPPAAWLTVPPTWRNPNHDDPDHGTIRVTLPRDLDDSTEVRRTVARLMASRLGVGPDDLDFTWHMAGPRPYLTARLAPRPPARVGLADVAEAVRSASDAAPVLGVGARGRIVAVNLDTDSPHLAISAASGAGKSVLLRGLLAQWLNRGVQILYLDGKMTSQAWSRDIPGVTYCHTAEAMHRALIEAEAETRRRYEIILAAPPDSETDPDVGGRIVVAIEEQNVAVTMLIRYWQTIRGQGEPKRSPALDSLDYLLCAGRQARVHVVSVAQYFTVQAAGGNPAARENYGARVMARASRNAWLMLAPEAGPPYPSPNKHRGRVYLVLSGEVTEVQAVFWSVAEARDYARTGPATVPDTWTTGAAPGWVNLAEAVRAGVVPTTYPNLRQRRVRSRVRFPEARADGRYRAADLAAWWRADTERDQAEAGPERAA